MTPPPIAIGMPIPASDVAPPTTTSPPPTTASTPPPTALSAPSPRGAISSFVNCQGANSTSLENGLQKMHHSESVPLTSVLLTGLHRQYANRFEPSLNPSGSQLVHLASHGA